MNKTITKHAGGRPTKYDPKFVEEVNKYLEESTREQMTLPKIESLAIRLDVSKKTLYNWGEQHPEFLHALEKVMLYQGERLIDDGIYGGKEVNATIIKLLLQNNHGMSEGPTSLQQINVGTDKGNTITFVNFKNESES